MAASVRFNLIYYLGDLWPISSSAGVVFFFLSFLSLFPPSLSPCWFTRVVHGVQ